MQTRPARRGPLTDRRSGFPRIRTRIRGRDRRCRARLVVEQRLPGVVRHRHHQQRRCRPCRSRPGPHHRRASHHRSGPGRSWHRWLYRHLMRRPHHRRAEHPARYILRLAAAPTPGATQRVRHPEFRSGNPGALPVIPRCPVCGFPSDLHRQRHHRRARYLRPHRIRSDRRRAARV